MIDLSFQRGATWEKDIEMYFPNGTKCMNWQDVKESHMLDDPHVVVNLDDIHGLIILLGAGLIAATLTLGVEYLIRGRKEKSGSSL